MRFPSLLFILAIMTFGFIYPVLATANAVTETLDENPQVLGVTQQDLDGDGTPDLTVIELPFATENDRVLVFDQSGDMSGGDQWQDTTDFRDDVWIFDVGADGTAQLIVDFDVRDDRYVAFVYDDLDGDGQVSYSIVGKTVNIEESSFWHVKVESESYWTEPGSLYGTDLTFLVDGYAGLVLYLGSRTGDQDHGVDGVVDWQLDIGDKDGDGINDYQLQQMISSFPVKKRIAGFPMGLYAQATNSQPSSYSAATFWPLLVGKHNYEAYRYFDHFPAIAVDWETATVDRIGILGFPSEAGYHVYSTLPVEKHTTNILNFENPMAYYDMADDHDGWPELQVRFDVAVPHDPGFPYPYAGKVETPNLEVNYSWDQDNDNRWDYKVNLGGNYPIDDVVEFPDFAIKSVPYDEIVPWVKDRTWDVAMLVHDNRPIADSEGMFGRGWQIVRGYADGENVQPSGTKEKYLMGFSDRPPTENYQDIQEGMRGDYSFQYFDTPKIYLSALDGQLHLSGAEKGVWNLGEDHRLRYANLSGDTYLDQWQDEHDGTVLQQLNYGAGVYVYSGNGEVRLKQTDLAPAWFEAQPPGDYEEWRRLDAQLKAHQTALAPDDFLGMLSQLAGPEMQIQGAALREFRFTSDGFRFVLVLEPGYRVIGPNLLVLDGLEPGEYLIKNHDGAFTIKPLTSAQLSLILRQSSENGAAAPAQFTIHNTGSADALGLTLVAEIVGSDGVAVELTRKPVDALAGEAARVLVDIPSTVENYSGLRARLEDGAGQVLAELKPTTLTSGPAAGRDAIFGIGQAPVLLPIVGLFAAFLALAALLAVSRRRGQAT